MPVQITIIGLNRVGASIGLALGKIKDQAVRIGNDRDPAVARQAEKLGAVDKLQVNLPTAVREADIVFLAVPIDEIRSTIEVIEPDLKPGCLLIDTSPVKGAVMQWVRELMPDDERYFVSLTPTLNPSYLMDTGAGPESAHADMFQNSLMLVTSQQGIDESAVTLATNLVQVLGATPLFTDVYEADGLMSYSYLLPELVSSALVNATTGQPGWREARKVAGHTYALATEPVVHHVEGKSFGQAAILNGENTVRVLDHVLAELTQIRDEIAAGQSAALQERLERAQKNRALWLQQRRSSDWEPKEQQHIPTGGEVIGRLFGVRPRKDRDQK
jgi:prephenate dehydrogenase